MSKIRYLLAGALVVAAAASANAQVGGDAERMSRIEAQMRNLTGQIETLSHTLAELQQQLKRMQDDNEFRFKSLETATAGPKVVPPAPAAKPAAGTATAAPAAGAPAAVATAQPPPGAAAQPPVRVAPGSPAGAVAAAPAAVPQPPAKPAAVANAPAASQPQSPGTDAIGALAAGGAPPLPAAGTQGPGAPPRPLGTLTVPSAPGTAGPVPGQGVAGDQPLDLSALAKGGGVVDGTPLPQTPQAPSVPVDQKAVASIAPSGDPQVDYKKAYESFVAGQYAASESAFRQFLAAYPSDERAADATYWLGQTLYSRGMYREAALEFVNGHKLYPKSLRAPDTMLLLGKSLAGIPERDAACQTFAAALKQYPQMTASLKSRVVSEQANAGC